MLERGKKPDIGLLVLRVTAGGMLLVHGIGKLTSIPGIFEHFPDPIGLGPTVSVILTVFAEVVCAVSVMLGFFTRFSAIPIVIMLLVAGLVVHAGDPWQRRELAFVYLVPFVTLLFTGGGRYALTHVIFRDRKVSFTEADLG